MGTGGQDRMSTHGPKKGSGERGRGVGGPCLESRAGERTTVCASQYSAQPDATPKMFCTSNDVVIVVGPSETPL